jgi:signal transduction histidine kinase
VSHDLRTPLTRLRLRATNIGDGKLRRTIETDLDEMEDMIEATLAFLHDDLSKEKVEPVDLMAILETIRADASDASEHVEVKGPRQLVIVGRYLALKRALTNLIQNAVKYGVVARVRVSSDDDNVFIIIEDDGPGLPIDLHEMVFEPFVRCETSRSRSTGGHGLGLSMARSVLRSHGGEVSIANGEPRGLKVVVQLPHRPTEVRS